MKIIIGLVLLFSAARLFFRRGDPPAVAPPPLPAALAVGSGIGFLSDLTGTGGGIFLTPSFTFFQLGENKTGIGGVCGIYFGKFNCWSGGFVSARQSIPALAFILSAAAIVGGAIGSYLGSRKFPVRTVSILARDRSCHRGFQINFYEVNQPEHRLSSLCAQ